MTQFLLKAKDAFNRVLIVLSQLIALLRSVQIDEQRAILLCIAFQLVVVVGLMLAFVGIVPGRRLPAAEQQAESSPAVLEPGEPFTLPDARGTTTEP